MPKLIEYKDMAPRAKAVVEGIAEGRGIAPADINNVWKALARHPAVMEQFAAEMKAAFAPGYIDTEMVRAVPEDVLKKIVARIPVGRLGKADENARGVLFLIADDAGFITGSTLSINEIGRAHV